MLAIRMNHLDVPVMVVAFRFNICVTVHQVIFALFDVCYTYILNILNIPTFWIEPFSIDCSDAYDENPKLCTAGKFVNF